MRAPLRVELNRRARGWSPSANQLARWAGAALGRRAAGRELGVCVVGAAQSRRLNAQFRGRDRATNVLSFSPAGAAEHGAAAAGTLGELVLCAGVLRAEARAQGKTLRAHWAHLIVHGTLHLAGYDHQDAAQALRMERREVAVLRRLGFANPYRGERRA
ncbi:MAG: rRNA maturation RNase YbeY [Proteobacteria bacterium]|nr:rRNA maturation RNase YbeY [Pseudomonadota bacterium]